jgi:hypothetical protein
MQVSPGGGDTQPPHRAGGSGGREIGGSFRDPSGFVFVRDGVLYRQVNRSFQPQFDRFMESGLFQALVDRSLLVDHSEADRSLGQTPDAYRVLRPEVLPFISYPYEWSFGQLKDAALATLSIQQAAMERGMSLRDANAYNMQFRRGRPILVDTLSFEPLAEGTPWVAYRQFCQHFLAPLALAAYRDVRLLQLSRIHLDGVPLDLAATLLPARARLRPGLLVHLFLHARSQRRHAATTDAKARSGRRGFTRSAFEGLIQSLRRAVERLRWEPERTVWSSYYAEAESYSAQALEEKKAIVTKLIAEVAPKRVWDLGANTGPFSRIAVGTGADVVSLDQDPGAVELNYREVVARGESNLLPLVMDVTNPSPSIGWDLRERLSLMDRGPVDLVMALALIHHLCIANNVPFSRVAAFLAGVGQSILVEFVPKGDPQVQRLLATREDVFAGYSEEAFERSFTERFTIQRREPIPGSQRILYLMRIRD